MFEPHKPVERVGPVRRAWRRITCSMVLLGCIYLSVAGSEESSQKSVHLLCKDLIILTAMLGHVVAFAKNCRSHQ
eukprot:6190722-Pleurochrysis_carterae.AAC.2